MPEEIFFIRSLTVQNIIMGIIAAIIISLLVRSFIQGKFSHSIALIVWALISLWFFNGPLWGFSAITVSPAGLHLDYGFLSVAKNTSLPPDTSWKIHTYMGGLRRMKKLYYLELADHRSLKIRGADPLATLQSIGAAIDRLNGRPMGGMEDRPDKR